MSLSFCSSNALKGTVLNQSLYTNPRLNMKNEELNSKINLSNELGWFYFAKKGRVDA